MEIYEILLKCLNPSQTRALGLNKDVECVMRWNYVDLDSAKQGYENIKRTALDSTSNVVPIEMELYRAIPQHDGMFVQAGQPIKRENF